MPRKKTHCKHGHKWTDENSYLYMTKNGPARKCRACTLKRLAETKEARKKAQRDYKLQAPTDTQRKHEEEAMRVNAITALQEQLDRETRAWMRPELKAKIKELVQ